MAGRVALLLTPRLLRTVRSSLAILRSNECLPTRKVIRLSGFGCGAIYRVPGTCHHVRLQLP